MKACSCTFLDSLPPIIIRFIFNENIHHLDPILSNTFNTILKSREKIKKAKICRTLPDGAESSGKEEGYYKWDVTVEALMVKIYGKRW